eukprot:m.562864 g.562864  ORF g.562864 m.562864 type:complete len:633 (-) comp22227_c0_seq6:285-2183(-)
MEPRRQWYPVNTLSVLFLLVAGTCHGKFRRQDAAWGSGDLESADVDTSAKPTTFVTGSASVVVLTTTFQTTSRSSQSPSITATQMHSDSIEDVATEQDSTSTSTFENSTVISTDTSTILTPFPADVHYENTSTSTTSKIEPTDMITADTTDLITQNRTGSTTASSDPSTTTADMIHDSTPGTNPHVDMNSTTPKVDVVSDENSSASSTSGVAIEITNSTIENNLTTDVSRAVETTAVITVMQGTPNSTMDVSDITLRNTSTVSTMSPHLNLTDLSSTVRTTDTTATSDMDSTIMVATVSAVTSTSTTTQDQSTVVVVQDSSTVMSSTEPITSTTGTTDTTTTVAATTLLPETDQPVEPNTTATRLHTVVSTTPTALTSTRNSTTHSCVHLKGSCSTKWDCCTKICSNGTCVRQHVWQHTTTRAATATHRATTGTPTARPSLRPTVDPSCISDPDWTDSRSHRCTYYAAKHLCTSAGAQGPGWKSWWKPYHTAARNSTTGVAAWQACCACGGGGTATPTSTAPAGTTDGSMRNATAGDGDGDGTASSVGIWTAVLVLSIIVVVGLVARSRWVKPRQGSYTHLDEGGFGHADGSSGSGSRRRGYDHDLTMDLMSIGPVLDDEDEDDLVFKSNRR